MEHVDFTNCRLIPGRTYNGANGKKIAIDYDGALYMLKFPSSGAVKPTELSYTNSCISEILQARFSICSVYLHRRPCWEPFG